MMNVRFQYKADTRVGCSERLLSSESNGMDSSSFNRHLGAKLEVLITS